MKTASLLIVLLNSFRPIQAASPLENPCLETCRTGQSEGGECQQNNVPRFLFSGQSNMVGYSNHALKGSFQELVKLINREKSKKRIKKKITMHLNKAKGSQQHTSENEARFLYEIRNYMERKIMFNDHETTTCSFTNPLYDKQLDCERPLNATACGKGKNQYGPEFMFGHVFPELDSPLQGQAISITKVASGGSQIKLNWMSSNKDEEGNFWYVLADAIKAANGTIEGFVWFQGENDSFDATNESEYLDNLTNFIADVRKEIFDASSATTGKFASPGAVPVVICALGNWRRKTGIIPAQHEFAINDDNAVIVETGASSDPDEQMSSFYHFDAASMLIIGERVAEAMAELLRKN